MSPVNEAIAMTRRPTSHHLPALFAALCAAWVPHAAQAQSSACEQLRSSLAARLDPAIRGYSMEVVPAKTPVPRGAKVIGNCEGGAKKVLFWRFGGSLPKASAASEVATAPAPTPEPVAPAPIPAPTPAPKKVEAAPVRPVPAPPPPAPVPPPPPPPAPVVRVAPVVVEPVVVARAAEPEPEASAPSVAPVTVPATEQASASETPAPEADMPESQGRHWAWWLALLPVVGGVWVWWARRSAYDASGLPRGPRLN